MYFLKYPHLFQLLFMHFLLGFKFFKIKKKMLKRAKQNTIQQRFCLEAPRWKIPRKTTPNPRKRSRQEASLRNIFMCTHTHAHARCRIGRRSRWKGQGAPRCYWHGERGGLGSVSTGSPPALPCSSQEAGLGLHTSKCFSSDFEESFKM